MLALVTACSADVRGNIAGTVTSETDATGVFGEVRADLTGGTVIGTFRYDLTSFSTSVVGDTNTAPGTGVGALTVTVTFGFDSHTFTDQTSTAIFLDTDASEITIQNANNRSSDNVFSMSENFYLNALDSITAFVVSTDLNQGFSSAPLLGSSGFSILNTPPDATASATSAVTCLSMTDVPKPAGAAILVLGLASLATRRLGAN